MKSFALLVEPDVAGDHAKHQAAPLLRVAIIGRCVNVEPDVLHVGEVAAQLLDHLVAFAFGAEAGAFHDFEFLELRPVLQDHIEIGIEAAGGDDDGFAADFKSVAIVLVAVTPQTRPFCVSSLPAVAKVMMVILGSDSAVLINAVIKPSPLLSGRCQRSTRLPS